MVTYRKRKALVMPAPIILHPSSRAPRYDAIEVLMIAAGVLLVVTMAFVF
jgi:hypothetical protein